jgi:hypothetical protein
MGFCVSYDELIVTHKGENKIRDILRAFKSKTYPIETIAHVVLEKTEQNERQNVYYEYLLNNYHNPFYDINESIINIPNNTNVITNAVVPTKKRRILSYLSPQEWVTATMTELNIIAGTRYKSG